jgi:hypothetical protein
VSDSPGAARGLDTIGWFIATLHSRLGHDKAAAVIGVSPGDKSACLICQYEAAPDDVKRQAVIRALAPQNVPEAGS